MTPVVAAGPGEADQGPVLVLIGGTDPLVATAHLLIATEAADVTLLTPTARTLVDVINRVHTRGRVEPKTEETAVTKEMVATKKSVVKEESKIVPF